METRDLIKACKDHFSSCGYEQKEPGGVLQRSSYPDTYNPCPGHTEIRELANSPRLANPVNWTSVEPVFRHLDAQKVGASRYHASLFEMLTFVDARDNTESSREKIILEQIGLYKHLGITLNRLHVTTFGGYELLGKSIPEDKEVREIWEKLLGKERVHPLRSTSNIEFLPIEGEQAGPRCEIFLERADDIFEIGTVVFDDYLYTRGSFKRIQNSIYGGAGGIERLEMAVSGCSSIQQVGTIKPIVDTVRNHARDVGDLRFLEDELFTASDNIKSALLITTEGQRKERSRRGQRLNRLINDARRSLDRLNIRDYRSLVQDISDRTRDLYKDRYPFYAHIDPQIFIEYLEKRKETGPSNI